MLFIYSDLITRLSVFVVLFVVIVILGYILYLSISSRALYAGPVKLLD